MADLSDADIDSALARGHVAAMTEPRATAAHYDAISGEVIIRLTNGCTFSFPAHLAQGLHGASPAELADITLLGHGYGLHWESLDVDLSIPGLMAGLFGTARHMARLGGQSRSPAKALAAKANGAKGGRPRKARA